MRVFIIVNHASELGFRQTTALLAASLCRLDHKVVIASVDAMSLAGSYANIQFTVNGIELPKSIQCSNDVEASASTGNESMFVIEDSDLILIRTNPGRDPRQQLHHHFLHLAMIATQHGITVVNHPSKLSLFASKSSLAMLDANFRPPMLVTSTLEEVMSFVVDAPSDCVVKPVVGSRGTNVLRVNKDATDLKELIESTFRDQQVIVQHFVFADHPGDRRIVVLDGDILQSPTGIAGIERHPAADDFRANLHAGGSAHPVSLSDSGRGAVKHAAKLLMENGIRLAGVDLIGDQIIELNVFSTGGLFDANHFASVDFAQIIAERIIQKQ